VAVHPGRAIVAALLKRGLDMQIWVYFRYFDEFGSFGSKIGGIDENAPSHEIPRPRSLSTLFLNVYTRTVFLVVINRWVCTACIQPIDPLVTVQEQ
jgi:hypothetical protein